jgi:hypothetical protein
VSRGGPMVAQATMGQMAKRDKELSADLFKRLAPEPS